MGGGYTNHQQQLRLAQQIAVFADGGHKTLLWLERIASAHRAEAKWIWRVPMPDNLTYMDCWNFIAPLIPVTDDQTSQWIYVMTFNALNEAEKRRVEKEKRKKCGEKLS